MPHPYGWLSLLPSLVAIGLAIATRRVVISLLAGIFVGALLTTGGDVPLAMYDALEVHLWPSVTSPGKLRIFCFTLLMGAMIGIIYRAGGMRGLVSAIKPFANTRRSGQLATWAMGLVIFFDDYANTLLLGSTFKSLCDRLKISREKLAYIVDSTAAPVAGLALVSTWVAVEIDYVKQGLDTLNNVDQLKAFDLFLASIPYRFYMLMALVFVPMVAILRRDFGPMLKAERNAADERIQSTNPNGMDIDDDKIAGGEWYHAVIPIVVTLGVVLVLLVQTGRANLADANPGLAADVPLREIFGAADSSLALQYGALVGVIVAALMAKASKLLSEKELAEAVFSGARVVLPAIAILSSAAALSRMTGNQSVHNEPTQTPYEFRDHRLYTGDFLRDLIAPDTNDPTTTESALANGPDWRVRTLPTIVFVLASVVAFSTGTSWGTMGILMPMVVTLAHALLTRGGATIVPTDPILLGSIGGVLAGAVFGDHCSPISDTTVLSSQSSGCDHIAHVRTQLPYALTVAVVAVLFGTLPLGWGVSVWLLLPVQFAVLVGVLLTIGRKT